jgi:hypothetical protein
MISGIVGVVIMLHFIWLCLSLLRVARYSHIQPDDLANVYAIVQERLLCRALV